MHALRDYLLQHKARLSLYALLAAATVFCLFLVRWRFVNQPDTYSTYAFLIQNLLLAWVPFIIAAFASSLTLPRRLGRIAFSALVILWLLFFPNSPYLLTDFQHLRLYSDDPRLWFDVIMVIWFVFTGLLLGLVSLHLMHRLVRRLAGTTAGWAFVILASLLSGAGIFAGKFLRLRSWEVFVYPQQYLHRLTQHRAQIADPVAYICLYAAFIVFIYVVFCLFAEMARKDAGAQ